MQRESTAHGTAILCLCPRWDAACLLPPCHGTLTIDCERAAAAVLAQLVLHQHAVLATVFECAGGDDNCAYATGGVVPELGVGCDVDFALVEGHSGPRVPKEGTGHGAVLATQHCVWLERGQEARRVAPVLLLVWLQLGAQVLDCMGGMQKLLAPPGPHLSPTILELGRHPTRPSSWNPNDLG